MIHPYQSLISRAHTWQSKHFERTAAGKALERFRGIHQGASCFLIGNGPSLRAEDLTQIKELGIPSFAFNRIYYIFDQTPWRPDYYISQDEQMLAGCAETVNRLELDHKFIPANLRWYFDIHIKGAHEFWLEGKRDGAFWFSDNFAHSVCWAQTVMYTAAQLAAYMGFRDIYLIGVDHHFRVSRDLNGNVVVDDSVKDYFTEAYNHDRDKLVIPSTDESTATYIAMKQHCDARGIRVFNATRGGRLEVFPRVNLDEVLQAGYIRSR